MKKLILSSAILAVLGMSANSMAANSGSVNFTGAVSTATCNLSVKDTAGADIANVDLGVLSTAANADGTAVTFKLVPKEADCLTKENAIMVWTSPTLNATGFSNATTTNGTNATMSLTASNSTATDKDIKQGNTSFGYSVTGGIKSYDFSAKLKRPATGAMTAGVFNATASYVVAYK